MNGQKAKQLRKEAFNTPYESSMLLYRTTRTGATINHPGSHRALIRVFKKTYLEILRSGTKNPFQTFLTVKESAVEELQEA